MHNLVSQFSQFSGCEKLLISGTNIVSDQSINTIIMLNIQWKNKAILGLFPVNMFKLIL
jgi:hypothetical protein